jgi:transcriptional regulator with XRE-family HTH domain
MPSVTPNGEAIRTRRNRLGLTQQEVAEKAGYSKKRIEDIEKGKGTSIGLLEAVAEVLELSVDRLLLLTDTNPETKAAYDDSQCPGIEIIINGTLSNLPVHVQKRIKSLVADLVGDVPFVTVREGSIRFGFEVTLEQAVLLAFRFMDGTLGSEHVIDVRVHNGWMSSTDADIPRQGLLTLDSMNRSYAHLASLLSGKSHRWCQKRIHDVEDAVSDTVIDAFFKSGSISRMLRRNLHGYFVKPYFTVSDQ